MRNLKLCIVNKPKAFVQLCNFHRINCIAVNKLECHHHVVDCIRKWETILASTGDNGGNRSRLSSSSQTQTHLIWGCLLSLLSTVNLSDCSCHSDGIFVPNIKRNKVGYFIWIFSSTLTFPNDILIKHFYLFSLSHEKILFLIE